MSITESQKFPEEASEPEVLLEMSDYGPPVSANGKEPAGIKSLVQASPSLDDDDEDEYVIEDPASLLPDEFWNARPTLQRIRAAAQSQNRSPDGVLHAVLALVAASVGHELAIQAEGVGVPSPLNYFTAFVGRSGAGKGNANKIANFMFPTPAGIGKNLPIGSGEGLVEHFLESRPIDPDDPKSKKVKVQTKHNAHFYVDEGATWAELGDRKGSTLHSTLRSMWSAESVGATNASVDTSRRLEENSYSVGMVISLQYATAEHVLNGGDLGTPQRFTWVRITMPNLSDEDTPAMPSPLSWEMPKREAGFAKGSAAASGQRLMGVDASVAAEVKRLDRESRASELDGHRPLMWFRIAGLLAILDERLTINPDDWELAGIVIDTSDAVRAQVLEVVKRKRQKSAEGVERTHVRHQVAGAKALEERDTEGCADRIIRWLQTQEGESATRGNTYHGVGKKWRPYFEDSLALLRKEGAIKEDFEDSPTGSPKHILTLPQGDES